MFKLTIVLLVSALAIAMATGDTCKQFQYHNGSVTYTYLPKSPSFHQEDYIAIAMNEMGGLDADVAFTLNQIIPLTIGSANGYRLADVMTGNEIKVVQSGTEQINLTIPKASGLFIRVQSNPY